MKKKTLVFIVISIIIIIGAVLGVTLFKEIKNQKVQKNVPELESWLYTGYLLKEHENYYGDLYGIDTTLYYNENTKTFYEKEVRNGNTRIYKILYYNK